MPSSVLVERQQAPHHAKAHANGKQHRRSSSSSANANGNGKGNGNGAHTNGIAAAGKPSSSDGAPASLDASAGLQAALTDLLNNPLRFDKSQMPPPRIKYPAINDPTNNPHNQASSSKSASASTAFQASPQAHASTSSSSSASSPSASTSASSPKKRELFPGKVPLVWPNGVKAAPSGLYNKGNTCYMNSTMQALVATAPLTHLLLTNEPKTLKGPLGGDIRGFDPVRALQAFTRRTVGKEATKGATAPNEFTKNLKVVAKTFGHGRQEDAHEWLRLLLDSIQQACLADASAKVKSSELRETTFVHKVFGGKLRSRVTCLSCKHNSDTFDPILDLSLDIKRCNTLGDAMDLFTAADELRGSEKYRCDKCKRLVNAKKHFAIESCPNVLTVHLKRFSFTGAKITRPIAYPEKFKMNRQWTSTGQDCPTYSLYAVVHHFGGGPHSGHYVADVKGPSGKWYRMNDDMVDPISKPGLDSKSAYLLFYQRDAKDSLQQAVAAAASTSSPKPSMPSSNGSAGPSPASKGTSRSSEGAALGSPNAAASSSSPPPSKSRFSVANGPKKHGNDFLNRLQPSRSSAAPSLLSPISPAAFHQSKHSSNRRALDDDEDLGESAGGRGGEDDASGADDTYESLFAGSGDAPQSRKEKRKAKRQGGDDSASSPAAASPRSIFKNFSPGGSSAPNKKQRMHGADGESRKSSYGSGETFSSLKKPPPGSSIKAAMKPRQK